MDILIGIIIKVINFILSTMLDGYLYTKEFIEERKKNKE